MVTAGILPFRENSHGRAGNRTRDLMISSQKLWQIDHEAGPLKRCCHADSKPVHLLAICFSLLLNVSCRVGITGNRWCRDWLLSETVRFWSSELRKFGHFNIMFFIRDKCSCNKNGSFLLNRSTIWECLLRHTFVLQEAETRCFVCIPEWPSDWLRNYLCCEICAYYGLLDVMDTTSM